MAGERIDLSVLIATHNRGPLLRRCLDALAAQTQDPASFEVIIADDGSTDGSAEALAALRTPFALRLLRPGKVGKSAALNGAIEVAQGSVCLFIDDDVIASPQLVAEHLAAHRRDPRTLGIGPLTQVPPRRRDWFAHTFATAWNDRYLEFDRRPARWTDCYGGNFSAPRATLDELGGFAAEMKTIEDFDIGYRLDRAGCVPAFLPRASGVHDDQKPRDRLLSDMSRNGAAYVEFAERHPETGPTLLDWAGTAGPRELRLRRALVAVRIPAGPIAALGRFVPGPGRKMIWLQFVIRLTFWRSVRDAVGDGEWARLTQARRVWN